MVNVVGLIPGGDSKVNQWINNFRGKRENNIAD